MRTDLNKLKIDLKNAFHGSVDLSFKEFYIKNTLAAVCFMDGLTDKSSIELNIINALIKENEFNAGKTEKKSDGINTGTEKNADGIGAESAGAISAVTRKKSDGINTNAGETDIKTGKESNGVNTESAGAIDTKTNKNESAAPPYRRLIRNRVSAADEFKTETDFGALAGRIADGEVALLIDGAEEFYLFAIKSQPSRAISEPPTSTVLKGPREGFTEDMKTNAALLRKRLRTVDFVVENFKIGRYTATGVAVAYISGIAEPKVVEKIKERLKSIDIDGIIDSSYLTEYLKERKYSMLKQIGVSEKPDIVTAKLLEGRVAIIADGSPIVLTVPFILLEDLQDSSDYYKNDFRSFFIRLIRIFGEILALLLPGFYVAVLTRHYQLLPMNFLISIITSVHELPFTAEIEMIFVLLLFEILNEASIRMPRYIGMSLSLIGAIILGDTAVKAGLISSPTVLIAAMSNIGIYCIPDEISSFSLFRLMLVLASSLFGFFGLILSATAIAAYLLTYNSYGAPYLAPFAPYTHGDMKDAINKESLINMKYRPRAIPNVNGRRQK
ncbi:MAG: spore germination protein [Clostridiales bacterium]|nr:spore germination protein [Clostridiales bacterium]